MFSATLHSPEVKRLAATICQQPLLVDLKGRDVLPEAVDHVLLTIDPAADGSWLQSAPKVAGGRRVLQLALGRRSAPALQQQRAASCTCVPCMRPRPLLGACCAALPAALQVFTDGVHALDAVSPAAATPECASEGVKRLKQRLLQRVIDVHSMGQALIFCRTNHDCDNLERFLNSLGGGSSGGHSFKCGSILLQLLQSLLHCVPACMRMRACVARAGPMALPRAPMLPQAQGGERQGAPLLVRGAGRAAQHGGAARGAAGERLSSARTPNVHARTHASGRTPEPLRVAARMIPLCTGCLTLGSSLRCCACKACQPAWQLRCSRDADAACPRAL